MSSECADRVATNNHHDELQVQRDEKSSLKFLCILSLLSLSSHRLKLHEMFKTSDGPPTIRSFCTANGAL